ncbi:hypothetical protein [Microvirga makkahensis]|uniref:Uncharacterized protein n=1 Tax=Microvirga makkahensis TaxID=1128670 RepID=A0A7X3SRL5_9HYPH|nr:hypothetical protein [Microvirga makkahensis]MXQ14478.1 hypothetical protein [Microvirga makkahensis]
MSQQSIHDRIMFRSKSSQAADETFYPPLKSRRKVSTVLLSVVGLVAVAGLGLAAMQYAGVLTMLQPSASAKTAAPDPSLPNTPFLAHAKQAGLKTCANVFPVLGQLLTNGSTYNVQTDWQNSEPDKHAVQALVGLDYTTQSYSGPAAGIVFAAPNGPACEGTMVRVSPFPKPCNEIPAAFAQGSKLENTLGQVAVYALANNGGQALLLPSSGNTCIVVSVAVAKG